MGKLTILSVDDNVADQKLIALALKAANSYVDLHTLGNGDEAIACLRRRGKYASAPRPDLIILDLNLPKVSGADVMREIRRDASLKDIPVVIFTGAKLSREMAALCEHNFSFYVVKPDGLTAFFAVIRAMEEYARSMVETPRSDIEDGEKLRRLFAA